MKTTKEKTISIVYYDKDGIHRTKPCDSLSVSSINYSVPSISEPTITYTLWFDDEEHTEKITVPFYHSIEPV